MKFTGNGKVKFNVKIDGYFSTPYFDKIEISYRDSIRFTKTTISGKDKETIFEFWERNGEYSLLDENIQLYSFSDDSLLSIINNIIEAIVDRGVEFSGDPPDFLFQRADWGKIKNPRQWWEEHRSD